MHHNLAKKIPEKIAVLLLIFSSCIFGVISMFFVGFYKLIWLIIISFFVLSVSLFLNKR